MERLRDKARHFCKHAGGGIALIFGLTLPAVLAVVGIATDYVTYSLVRTNLQATVDGAAAAGAREFAIAGVQDSDLKSLISAFIAQEVDQSLGPTSYKAEIDKAKFSVTVSVQQDWTPFFAHFLNADITPVRAVATAVLTGTANICVLTLAPKGDNALHLDKEARLQANGCGAYSNSKGGRGIAIDSNATIEAALICSVGGVSGKKAKMSPDPTTDCPVLRDPLSQRVPPEVGLCDLTNVKVKDEKKTLAPGTYCGGLEVSGTSQVLLSPGTYVIKGGAFKVTGNASIEGINVGIYLAGNEATIDFNGNTSVSLSGAEEGAMAGLLFFEDRTAKLGRNHRINSANAHKLTGTIYLPRGRLQIDPNAKVAADSAYTAVVAYQVELNEGPMLVLNSNYGATDVPVPKGIRVTGRIVLVK